MLCCTYYIFKILLNFKVSTSFVITLYKFVKVNVGILLMSVLYCYYIGNIIMLALWLIVEKAANLPNPSSHVQHSFSYPLESCQSKTQITNK